MLVLFIVKSEYLSTILEKVMVKFTLGQAMKIQRGSRGTGLIFLWPRRQILVHGQRHAPAALPPEKETRYPVYRKTNPLSFLNYELDGDGIRNLICEGKRTRKMWGRERPVYVQV